jgi:hypothetical protein
MTTRSRTAPQYRSASTRYRTTPTRFNFDTFSKENIQRLKEDKEEINNLYDIESPQINLSLEKLDKCDMTFSFVDPNETSEAIWNHFIQRNCDGSDRSAHNENIDYINDIKKHIEETNSNVSGTYRIYAQCTDFSKEIPTDPMHFFIILSISGKEVWVNHSGKGCRIISISDSFGLSNSPYNFVDTTFYIELFKGYFTNINMSKLFTDILRFSYKHDKWGNNSVYPGTCSGLTLCVAQYIDETKKGKEFLKKMGQSQIATFAKLKIKQFIN